MTATAIASRPVAGRVTSHGRTMPRKADRIDSLRPLAPADAPASTWVVDRGAPKYAPADTKAAVAIPALSL